MLLTRQWTLQRAFAWRRLAYVLSVRRASDAGLSIPPDRPPHVRVSRDRGSCDNQVARKGEEKMNQGYGTVIQSTVSSNESLLAGTLVGFGDSLPNVHIPLELNNCHPGRSQ